MIIDITAKLAAKAPDKARQTAMGRSRGPALQVLMPRIMGALEAYGTDCWYSGPGPRCRQAEKGEFVFQLSRTACSWYFSVWWRGLRVMTGHILDDRYADGRGSRVEVVQWDRSVERRQWQSLLFGTIQSDGPLPKSLELPRI